MKNKSRLFLILELLYKNTDEEHFETTKSILDWLEKNGSPADRKTLQHDIELLQKSGFGIGKIKSSTNEYYMEKRLFKQAELQMMTDAVLSSSVISKKKSEELISKFCYLTSQHNAESIKNQMTSAIRPKSKNPQVYHTINIVYDAIKRKVPISFNYIDYNQYKEKVYRNDGKPYHVSPYTFYWNSDNYYLIGWDEKYNNVTAFRVDRMEGTMTAEENHYVPKPENLTLEDLAEKYFQMYGGDEENVTLEVDNDLMRYIIDRFGFDVETEVNEENSFLVKTSLRLSPTFYGWVFQFAGKIRILGPEKAVKGYKAMLKRVEERL